MPYDTSSTVHCRSSSQTTPATSLCGFSMTLTTTPHSTQQLMAVWDPLLQDDPEGPTFISNTALLSSDSGFYIRTSQSHSRHTVGATQRGEVGLARVTAPHIGIEGHAMIQIAPVGAHPATRECARLIASD